MSKPVLQEQDWTTLAKLVRNLECTVDLKERFIHDVAKYFSERDQFFNAKRFIAIATQSLMKEVDEN